MKIDHFKSTKTTKIAILGDLENASQVWIVLHGYGQLAHFFIQKFKVLAENNIAIIAPEAQSRFYNKGFNGRVGATWMTSEERDIDIEDYLNYLQDVYQNYQLNTKQVTLLGFSQGAATASRLYALIPHLFHNLVLWCSVFPPDFNLEGLIFSKCIIVIGDNDPFMDDEKYNSITDLGCMYPSLKIIYFQGGHNIHLPTLKKIANLS